MKVLTTIIFAIIVFTGYAQDSVLNINKQVFIDSLKPGETFLIEGYYSTCFLHKKFTLFFKKQAKNYLIKIIIRDNYAYQKTKRILSSTLLNYYAAQIDSVRRFEKYLNIYPSEDSDGQRYYFYTLSLGKREKRYFDGIQTAPWMKIEGLVKILFPVLNLKIN
jgi:hypothetical protein